MTDDEKITAVTAALSGFTPGTKVWWVGPLGDQPPRPATITKRDPHRYGDWMLYMNDSGMAGRCITAAMRLRDD